MAAGPRDSTEPAENPQYVEVMRQIITTNAPGWVGIALLTVVSVWGDWRKVAIIVGAELFLVPFNMWVTLRLNAQLGPARAELLRAAVDLAGTIAVAVATGWPLPLWFRLPFVALAFDHLSRPTAVATLVVFSLGCDIAALLDGVHWSIPLFFTVLAGYCGRVSHVRTRVIRAMLTRSDSQRAELEAAHRALHEANRQLVTEMRARTEMELERRQAQKLEAVGRLAAGIAHEINTPAQFAGDNVEFAREACADLVGLVDDYQAAIAALRPVVGDRPELAALADAEAAADLPYLREHLGESFAHAAEGLGRIAGIVRSVKAFAHPEQTQVAAVDLGAAIQTTLVVARGSYKDLADVEVDLGDVPPILGHGGEINQVILNLIVNAADAIADARPARRGVIVVRTRADAGHAVMTVADNGCGIADDVRERIFEPFFTTKEVGRGSGQGLAIIRAIVRKHGGSLSFTSAVGAGTTFTVRLPTVASAALAA
jgi:signal transduction histidine kinase